MPRYIVERSDAERLRLSAGAQKRDGWDELIETNAAHGVTWLHSYLTAERGKTFCVCDAPTPEAIRAAARSTDLSIDRITEVRVLDPYLHV